MSKTESFLWRFGRGERIRTSDPSVPNRVLYQAEPRPDLSVRANREPSSYLRSMRSAEGLDEVANRLHDQLRLVVRHPVSALRRDDDAALG
jgi:hypothetical protein